MCQYCMCVCVKERDVVYINKWFVRGKIVFMFSVSFCLLETPEKGDHFPKWMCFCDIKSPQRCPANVSRQMPQKILSFLCQNKGERERKKEKGRKCVSIVSIDGCVCIYVGGRGILPV